MEQGTGAGGGRMAALLFIALTIVFTVAGQLLIKYATFEIGQMPGRGKELGKFAFKAYTNWKVIAGLLAAFAASFTWLGAVSRSDISFAYPFMGLAIVLVLAVSPLLFGESVPITRWIGVMVVCVGIWIAARN